MSGRPRHLRRRTAKPPAGTPRLAGRSAPAFVSSLACVLFSAVALTTFGSSGTGPRVDRIPSAGAAFHQIATRAHGAKDSAVRWRIAAVQTSFQNGELRSVACPAPNNCWAVGDYGRGVMIERLSNGSWKNVYHGMGTTLFGISCPQIDDCWAVGSEVPPGAQNADPLVLHYDGTGWTTISVPAPPQVEGGLRSVSCNSPQDCWAVGTTDPGGGFTQGQAGLGYHFDGQSWSEVTFPTITSGVGWEFTGVSCGSDNCWATGQISTDSNGDNYGLVEHLSGTTWAVNNSPSWANVSLAAVTCPTESECLGVGQNSSMTAYIEHGNGATWIPDDTQPRLGATSVGFTSPTSELDAIACTSATNCWTGGVAPVETGEDPIFVHWNGSIWGSRTSQSPDPGFHNSGSTDLDSIDSLACISTSNCWAVGTVGGNGTDVFNDPLIVHLS